VRLRGVELSESVLTIPFDQVVEVAPGIGSIRIIIVDEN
jgi:hypothetical protein